jgi:hypothetical protein
MNLRNLPERIDRFSKIATRAVLSDDSYFYLFGEGNCDSVFIDGLLNKKVREIKVVRLGENGRSQGISKDVLDEFRSKINRVNQLREGKRVGSFSLTKAFRDQLKKHVVESKATHIQFESDGEVAKAHVFDIIAANGRSAWRSSYVSGAIGLPLIDATGSFTFSVRSDTFIALPSEAATVSLFSGGLMRITYTRDGIRATIRDQEVRKPFTTFTCLKAKREVVFLFHPPVSDKWEAAPTDDL